MAAVWRLAVLPVCCKTGGLIYHMTVQQGGDSDEHESLHQNESCQMFSEVTCFWWAPRHSAR